MAILAQRWRQVAYLLCAISSHVQIARGHHYPDEEAILRPIGLALGSSPSFHCTSFRPFTLNQSTPVVTLDYGSEIAGYPWFHIEFISGHVQFEVKYSEEFSALSHNFSDGPFPYAVTLANTYRVETFEVREPGYLDSFLLQGGQRWQSIRLISGSFARFSAVGFTSSVPVIDMDELPGAFKCDDKDLNDIWKLGARACHLACLPSGSQRDMWEVSPRGVYVRGSRADTTPIGTTFRDYTLEFDAMIEKGGIGWTVAFPLASPARGIQLNLVAHDQLYVNSNTTLLPPNRIIFGYGSSIVNQTTLLSFYLDTFEVPFVVQNNTWYRIKTVLDGKHLAVSIAGTDIFNLTLSDYWVSDVRLPTGIIDTLGSWGFGGWQDQAGYFKDVLVYDTANGSEIYRNPMTDASESGVIREYGVQANSYSVCLDGPKRDRLVWLGDFLHTVRIIAASTSRFDLAKGTLQFLVDWQTPTGLMPYAPPIGYTPALAGFAFSRGGGAWFQGNEVYSYILADYQILGVLAFTEYIRLSGDVDFAMSTWANWKASLSWINSNINSTTALLTLRSSFLGPASAGSAINCAFVEALTKMAEVAMWIGETSDAEKFSNGAAALSKAINQELWNEELGIYGLSTGDMKNFSVNSIAFCVTSGTASPEQAARLVAAAPNLLLWPGLRDSSASTPASEVISPNTNGFILKALLSQGTNASATLALNLVRSLWTPMLANKTTSTGASWEYVDQQGGPGLGLFTSLAHPWGGAPTYILTEWVAGLQMAEGPEGFGYRRWEINPFWGVQMGLKEMKAKVVTAYEGSIELHWQVRLKKGTMEVRIWAPRQTSGVFTFGNYQKELSGSTSYHFEFKL